MLVFECQKGYWVVCFLGSWDDLRVILCLDAVCFLVVCFYKRGDWLIHILNWDLWEEVKAKMCKKENWLGRNSGKRLLLDVWLHHCEDDDAATCLAFGISLSNQIHNLPLCNAVYTPDFIHHKCSDFTKLSRQGFTIVHKYQFSNRESNSAELNYEMMRMWYVAMFWMSWRKTFFK